MKIESVERLDYPVELVYRTFRDSMPDIARFVPNVDRIEVIDRADLDDGRTLIVNHWFAVGDIPAVAKGIIKPEMLSWKDTAHWSDDESLVHWEMETHFFTDSVDCKGVNRFVRVSDDATEVRLEGDLQINLSELPMVPRLLKKKVAVEIERFITMLIQPNLANAVKGVRSYLDEQAG